MHQRQALYLHAARARTAASRASPRLTDIAAARRAFAARLAAAATASTSEHTHPRPDRGDGGYILLEATVAARLVHIRARAAPRCTSARLTLISYGFAGGV